MGACEAKLIAKEVNQGHPGLSHALVCIAIDLQAYRHSLDHVAILFSALSKATLRARTTSTRAIERL
jgi:hypothetical protein